MKPHKDNIALAKFASAMSDKLAKKRRDGKHGWPTAPRDFLSDFSTGGNP